MPISPAEAAGDPTGTIMWYDFDPTTDVAEVTASTPGGALAPNELLDVRPAMVGAMNSIYLAEIDADLTELGLECLLDGL